MIKNAVIIGVMVLVVVIAGMVLSQKQPGTDSMKKNDETVLENVQVSDAGMMKKTDSQYQPYSQAAFAAASGKKRVLYFHADWCPVCRPLDQEFSQKADEIPSDVVLFKTNYDTETELKKQYAIAYQHTFVQVDATGNEVAKWSGGGLDELRKNVK